MYVLNRDHTIAAANRATSRLFQMKFRDLIGRKCHVLFEERDVPCRDCPAVEVFRTAREAFVERCTVGDGGRRVDLRIRALPLTDGSGKTTFALIYRHDMTESKALGQAQRDLEKLRVVERVSSLLAHELKNHFAVVGSAVQLLEKELRDRRELREYTRVIQSAVQRSDFTLRRLLASSRIPRVRPRPVDLNATIARACSYLGGEFERFRTRVRKRLRSDLPLALADEAQIERCLINIILNAVQAMPNGGSLTISTRAQPGQRNVIVDISDQGPGIPREILARVFEPFFTTRDEGTGLGLWMCQQSLTAQKGSIAVANRRPHGVRVSVVLPTCAHTRDHTRPHLRETKS
jgi:two-component system nitrogen regulation sensor histidine kinase GlnL